MVDQKGSRRRRWALAIGQDRRKFATAVFARQRGPLGTSHDGPTRLIVRQEAPGGNHDLLESIDDGPTWRGKRTGWCNVQYSAALTDITSKIKYVRR